MRFKITTQPPDYKHRDIKRFAFVPTLCRDYRWRVKSGYTTVWLEHYIVSQIYFPECGGGYWSDQENFLLDKTTGKAAN